jgi:hypothetical protein
METMLSTWLSPPHGADSPWRYFLMMATAVFHGQNSLHFPAHSENAKQIWFPDRTRRRMTLAYRRNRALAFVRMEMIQDLTDRQPV